MINVYIIKTESLCKGDFFKLADELPFGDTERSRLMAIKSSEHKWESLGGLVALWRLLSKQGLEARTIARTSDGKPYFEGDGAPPFSISHSRGYAAAAVGSVIGDSLGLDIERADGSYDYSRLAERFFSEQERKALKESDFSPEKFFELWTSKEAHAKKSGRGLALILSEGKNATDGFVSGFRITAGEHCLIGSVCYDAPRQTVNIFIDGEDTDELQN